MVQKFQYGNTSFALCKKLLKILFCMSHPVVSCIVSMKDIDSVENNSLSTDTSYICIEQYLVRFHMQLCNIFLCFCMMQYTFVPAGMCIGTFRI